jgi:RNA polymerase sigma-70 factor (ECF subfamily)
LIEEDALLARLRDGDQAAFERLFLRHYAQVYRVLYHLVGSREEAEDLAQETFLALYHRPLATGMGATLGAWLCRVGLNRVYRANNRLKHVNSGRNLLDFRVR